MQVCWWLLQGHLGQWLQTLVEVVSQMLGLGQTTETKEAGKGSGRQVFAWRDDSTTEVGLQLENVLRGRLPTAPACGTLKVCAYPAGSGEVCLLLGFKGGSGMALETSQSSARAGVAQLVEHLICNQTVGGSNPFASSKRLPELSVRSQGCRVGRPER